MVEVENSKHSKDILQHLELVTVELDNKLEMDLPGHDELRILKGDIQSALAETGDEPQYAKLENSLKETSLVIESKYPELSVLLGKVAEMLSSAGI